jgi:putative restriction endonuclease
MCRFHHWAFDNGLFAIKDDFSIIVEDRIKGDSNYEEIWEYENKSVAFPKDKGFLPHELYLKAHRKLHGFE